MKVMNLLSARIARLEFKIKELLDELEEIKKTARLIEQENEHLRKELALNMPCNANDTKDFGHNHSLIRLYDEGFHICNVKFAKKREKECLFCTSLLMRVKGGDEKGDNE